MSLPLRTVSIRTQDHVLLCMIRKRIDTALILHSQALAVSKAVDGCASSHRWVQEAVDKSNPSQKYSLLGPSMGSDSELGKMTRASSPLLRRSDGFVP